MAPRYPPKAPRRAREALCQRRSSEACAPLSFVSPILSRLVLLRLLCQQAPRGTFSAPAEALCLLPLCRQASGGTFLASVLAHKLASAVSTDPRGYHYFLASGSGVYSMPAAVVPTGAAPPREALPAGPGVTVRLVCLGRMYRRNLVGRGRRTVGHILTSGARSERDVCALLFWVPRPPWGPLWAVF